MKASTLAIFLTIAISSAHASGPGFKPLPANTDPDCITNPNDPYEPRVRMNTGEDKGVCVNSTLRRSATLLEGEEAAKYFPPTIGRIVVANISHQNKYWVAQIPINSISKMVLQSEHFPMIKGPLPVSIDHTQIRVDFSRNIFLVPQTSDEPFQKIKLRHLIYSNENIGPYGEAFDFFEGAKGKFNVAYRLVSLADKYDWMVVQNKDIVSQRQFNLPKNKLKEILLEGINRGTKYGSSRAYDSYNLNCSTEILSVLNTVLGTPTYPNTGFFSNKLPARLEKMGILTKDELPTFNDEYSSLE